jgi:phosphoglycerate dehydrogenase-like enzyme
MRIVVADANLTPHRERFESRLPVGTTLVWHDKPHDDALAADIPDAEVFVGSTFAAPMAKMARKLRLVHAAGAGTDGIAFDALPADVLVANTFNHEQSIAEYVVAASILLRRRFLDQDRQLRNGVWASPVYDRSLTQPDALGSAHVGFVGFGHIGRRCWNLLRQIGCTASAVTGRGVVEESEGLRWVGRTERLGELMTESDVVVVSAPLSESTAGMIGESELRALGPAGVLLNVGRGPLVQEAAIYAALAKREIAGAALDVWYDYPANGVGSPSSFPFAELDNVFMTPHSSGITRQTFIGRVDDITANIARLQRGEALRNLVAANGGSPA